MIVCRVKGTCVLRPSFKKKKNGKKSGKMRAPGPVAEVGESVAEEIRMIE